MSILPILKEPDPRLHIRCTPVQVIDHTIEKNLADMLETMYHAKGIGLAAPQVNIPLRMLVMDVTWPEKHAPLYIINPTITWSSSTLHAFTEGCLSVPEYYGEVSRPSEVKVQFLDREGQTHTMHFSGLASVCIQHEIDHLDGKVFLDYFPPVERKRVLKKLQKQVYAEQYAF